MDYVGVGPVWTTQTKQLTSSVVGVRGIGALLEVLDDTEVKAVAIGEFKDMIYGDLTRLGYLESGDQVYQCPSLPSWGCVRSRPQSGRSRCRQRYHRLQRPLQCREENRYYCTSVQRKPSSLFFHLSTILHVRRYQTQCRRAAFRSQEVLSTCSPSTRSNSTVSVVHDEVDRVSFSFFYPDHQHSRYNAICQCDNCPRSLAHHGYLPGRDGRSK